MDQNLPFTPNLNPQLPDANRFTPISELFKPAWEKTQKNLLKLFLLTIIPFVIGGIGLVILFSLILIFGTLGSSAILNPMIVLVTGVSILIGVIALLVVNISIMLVLAESQTNLSLIDLIKLAFKKVVPLLVLSLLSGLIVAGGFVMLIIPGILFAILLSYSSYYLILDQVSPIEAMRKSVYLVSKNFGVIFIRLITLFGMSFVIGILFNMLSSQNNGFSLLSTIISMIFNLVFGWFSISFLIIVFQEAKKIAGDGKGKLLWMVIVALIGWIIILGSSYLVYRTASNSIGTSTVPLSDTTQSDLELLQSIPSESPVSSIIPSSAGTPSSKPAASIKPSVAPKASVSTSSANR